MVFKKGWNKKPPTGESAPKSAESSDNTTEDRPPSPIHKAFYIEKINGRWKLNICDVQDDKIISKQVKDCDSKAMSLESFKIEFAKTYYFGK